MSQEEESPQEKETEQSDQAALTEESPDGGGAEEAVASEEINRPPFALQAGAAVSYGQKKGRVIATRGNGAEPYEVSVRWTGEKHPVWALYRSLKLAYEQGDLLITQRRRPWWKLWR